MKEFFDILTESKTHQILFSMLVVGIIGTVVILILERKLRRRGRTDQEKIFDLARERNCSEFDIFHDAGEDWKFSEHKIEEDFKRYLMSNELPHYVSSYMRGQEEQNERSRSKNS